jgi:hypothetical protein
LTGSGQNKNFVAREDENSYSQCLRIRAGRLKANNSRPLVYMFYFLSLRWAILAAQVNKEWQLFHFGLDGEIIKKRMIAPVHLCQAENN